MRWGNTTASVFNTALPRTLKNVIAGILLKAYFLKRDDDVVRLPSGVMMIVLSSMAFRLTSSNCFSMFFTRFKRSTLFRKSSHLLQPVFSNINNCGLLVGNRFRVITSERLCLRRIPVCTGYLIAKRKFFLTIDAISGSSMIFSISKNRVVLNLFGYSRFFTSLSIKLAALATFKGASKTMLASSKKYILFNLLVFIFLPPAIINQDRLLSSRQSKAG